MKNNHIDVCFNNVYTALKNGLKDLKKQCFGFKALVKFKFNKKVRDEAYKQTLSSYDKLYANSILLDVYLVSEHNAENLDKMRSLALRHNMTETAERIDTVYQLTILSERNYKNEAFGCYVFYTFLSFMKKNVELPHIKFTNESSEIWFQSAKDLF